MSGQDTSQQALKELCTHTHTHTHTMARAHARTIRRPTGYDLLIYLGISHSHQFGYFKMDHDHLSVRIASYNYSAVACHYTMSVADASHPFLLYMC